MSDLKVDVTQTGGIRIIQVHPEGGQHTVLFMEPEEALYLGTELINAAWPLTEAYKRRNT